MAERDVKRLREQLEEREEEVETLRREMIQFERSAKKSAAEWRKCCADRAHRGRKGRKLVILTRS